MILAKLPNGHSLHFPDGTPEKVIDDAIKEHIKTPLYYNSKDEKKIINKLEQLGKEIYNSGQKDTVSPIVEKLEKIVSVLSAPKEDKTAPKIDALMNEYKGGTKVLKNSNESLNGSIKELILEIRELRKQQERDTKSIIDVLKSPRKLIKDSDGNPIGSKLK